MELNTNKEMLSKAMEWHNKLLESGEGENASLLKELILEANKSVETSFGTLYPTPSRNSKTPGIQLNLINIKGDSIALAYLHEDKERKMLSLISWDVGCEPDERILFNEIDLNLMKFLSGLKA